MTLLPGDQEQAVQSVKMSTKILDYQVQARIEKGISNVDELKGLKASKSEPVPHINEERVAKHLTYI